jgi:lipoyl-dependent peroxiredoxin
MLFTHSGWQNRTARRLTCPIQTISSGTKQHKKDATKAKVICAVTIGPREGGGFGLAVKLNIEDKSIPQTDLAGLAKEAHEKICPYSHATRGNVEVLLEVVGA